MATPLLSRFDLVILLLDEQNKDWDTKVCDFILRGVSLINFIHINPTDLIGNTYPRKFLILTY